MLIKGASLVVIGVTHRESDEFEYNIIALT